MRYSELQKKTRAELEQLLGQERSALQKARFSAGQKQLKNVRVLRESKRYIAQMLTLLAKEGALA